MDSWTITIHSENSRLSAVNSPGRIRRLEAKQTLHKLAVGPELWEERGAGTEPRQAGLRVSEVKPEDQPGGWAPAGGGEPEPARRGRKGPSGRGFERGAETWNRAKLSTQFSASARPAAEEGHPEASLGHSEEREPTSHWEGTLGPGNKCSILAA